MQPAKIWLLCILVGHDYCVSPQAFHHDDSEYVPQTRTHNIHVVLVIPVTSDILGHGEDEASQTMLRPVITACLPLTHQHFITIIIIITAVKDVAAGRIWNSGDKNVRQMWPTMFYAGYVNERLQNRLGTA